MDPKIIIIISVMLFLLLAVFTLSFICYRIVFYSSPKKRIKKDDEYSLQESEMFKPYREIIIDFIKKARATPHINVSTTSYDGLKLCGRYFEYSPDAPIEIIFHGYRGDSESDLSGAVIRCFTIKHNALLVDQRASGKSEGNTITFGVKEYRDCLPWINFVIENINENAKIILCGVSMGATTVLNACNLDLPKNVKAIMADCGFTSPKEIIYKVMKEDMNLPPKLLYPFIKLGAIIFGKFNPDEISPIETLKNSKLPIFLVHGDDDKYVPYDMSVKNFNACTSKKYLATIETAGHGLAYIVNPEKYVKEMQKFCDKYVK